MRGRRVLLSQCFRIREELVGQRTAKANQIRGLVGGYGLIAPKGIHQLRRALPGGLEDA